MGNHGNSGGDARDGAAAAGGDRGAHEEEHIGGLETIYHLLIVEHTFHGNIHGQILKTFAKRGFAEFRVAAKDREAQFAEFLCGVPDGCENNFRFAGAGISTGDAENCNRGRGGVDAGTAEVML